MNTNRDSFDYSFRHTQERLWERHGLRISLVEYRILCREVKYLNGDWENNTDDPQKITRAIFRGVPLKFVWSQRRDCITTVLPKETHV